MVSPFKTTKYVLMVSFLPALGIAGVCVWALTVPIKQQNTIKSPNNFIILLTTKLMHFFLVFHNNLQFKCLLQVYDNIIGTKI
jgi:hypothetical protein